MSAVLGISAWYHDSASALVVGQDVVAAAQEERFTRIRHDAAVPVQAMNFCLERGGVRLEDLEWVAFYEKPLRRFDRILESHFATAPFGFSAFRKALPVWLQEKLHVPRELREALGGSRFKGKFAFTEHHEAHAASAFFPSPFERAAIITCDGSGEWATTTWGSGAGNRLQLRAQLSFPHSLGLLYSAFTGFCGFKVNSGEYKLMGLAPYGKPRFAQTIRERLIDVKDDGSFRLAMEYFDFTAGLRMTNAKFDALFGGPPRSGEARLAERELDLAASIQLVTEEVLLKLAHHVARETKEKNLCLAGGVALNCVANARLLREGPFENVWVQPAAGDAGGALGAALFTRHQLLDQERTPNTNDSMRGSLLGPSFADDDIAARLEKLDVKFTRGDATQQAAALLANGKVLGWFQGAMEFGPRALGSRSILADPREAKMQSVLNQKVKFRETFRPFAPAVLAEKAASCFDTRGAESPYMLFTAPVLEAHRQPHTPSTSEDLTERAAVIRSTWPGITHVDFSARLQTVDRLRFPRFHELLSAFEAKTGCPMLINTSFNVRGEPIVCTPEDAVACFLATDLDALIIGDCVALKSEQSRSEKPRIFEPD
ncbi:MAG: carbamoyltransferase N-terminal domain-containing protein [Archangium sp.]